MKLFGKGGKGNGRKDYAKLPAAERVITFYAEDGGSWPHLEPIVTASSWTITASRSATSRRATTTRS